MIQALAPQARDLTHRRYRRADHVDRIEQRKNRHKLRVRVKVEHPFLVLKVIFSFRKVRYRGLAKNAQRLKVAFALVNVFMLCRPLLRLAYGTCR